MIKKNIEQKETWKKDYLKQTCGFANAQGRKIYIGKNDDGTVTGITNAKKLLKGIVLTQFLFEKTGITQDSISLNNLSADDF